MSGQPGGIGPDAVLALDPAADLLASGEVIVSFLGAADAARIEDLDPADLRAILARVDGRTTAGAIAAALAADYDPDSVLAVLGALVGRGLRIGEREDLRRLPPDLSLLVLGGGPLADAIAASLAGATRPPALAPLRRDQLDAELSGRDLAVAVIEDVPFAVPLDIARAALAVEVPVLYALVQRDGSIVLGPTMVPWKSPCFACSRLGAALRVAPPAAALDLLPQLSAGRIAAAAPPWFLPLAADEVLREVAAFFAGRYPRFLYQLVTIGPDGARASEELHAVTDCPLCHGLNRRGIRRGRPELPAAGGPAWSGGAVVERAAGLRTVGPDEARRRAERAMDRLGLTLVMEPADPEETPLWALDSGCAYFHVKREPRFDPAMPWIPRAETAAAHGKGTSDQQAWCSAAFEWFERERGDYVGQVDIVRAAYREVADLALDVPRYLAGLVPALGRGVPFDPDAEIDWIWGTCLRRRRPLLVPAAAAYVFNGRFRGSDVHWPRRGSSGQAAGCTLEDTVLEGLLEVVEHDACFVAYRTGLPFPRLDLASVDDPAARDIIDRLHAAGCTLQARDVTNELGVPVLEAYVLNPADPLRNFACGRGAHLDPRIALRRALTEAMQCIYASRPPREHPYRALTALYARFVPGKHILGRFRGTRRFAELPDLSGGLDAGGAVDRVVELIGAALPDHDVCYVDRSRPELDGIRVVNVIVSGVLDEVTEAAVHIPERVRALAPLEEMFLGRCD